MLTSDHTVLSATHTFNPQSEWFVLTSAS